MPIVDPFETSSAAPKGIIDPFATPGATPETGGIMSDFGKETAKAFMSGYQQLHPALTQTPPDKEGFWSGMLHVPGAGLAGEIASRASAPLQMALSPATGLLMGPGARGLAGLESYAGEGLQKLGLASKEITPDRQQMYEQAQKDIGKALAIGGPVRAGSVGAAVPWGGMGQAVEGNIAVAQAQEAAAAAKVAAKAVTKAANTPAQQAQQELQQAGTPVDIPRGLTYENPVARGGTVMLAKTPFIGTPLDEAIRAVPAQIGTGLETMAGKFSPKTPENIVGGGIERSLTAAGEQETAARKAAAATADEAAQQTFEQNQQAREQAIRNQQTQVETDARNQFGSVHPIEHAENSIRAVQEADAQHEAATQRNWEAVRNVDASVEKDSFHNLHETINKDISSAGVTLDPENTPNAWNMMQEVRRLSARPGELPTGVPPRLLDALEREYGKGQVPPRVLEDLGFPGGTTAQDPNFRLMGQHAPSPDATSVPVQGMDMLRRRIGDMAFNAARDNATDRRASNAIKNAFGNWFGDALENHLTPGSSAGARSAIDNAVASTRNYKERFGYNHGSLTGETRSVAQILNQMATGDVGPEKIARNLIGAKPGYRDLSAPLHDAILNAVDNPAQIRLGTRGAYWHAITEGRTPDAIASAVHPETGLQSSRMADLFTPGEHGLMRQYADINRSAPEQLTAIGKEKPPKPTKVEPGPAQQLASRVVGKNTVEALDTFDNALRDPNKIKEAARIWGRMSDINRNEARGVWLRNMGGGGEDFNIAKFIKNWDSYSDQAKVIMLPDRTHRKQVQNFYTLTKEYKDNLARFGNVSGTAPMTFFQKLMTGTVKTAMGVAAGTMSVFHPIGMVAAGLGGRGIASLLARPESAAQLTRWTRMAQAYNSAPSTAKLITLQNATRLLAQESKK